MKKKHESILSPELVLAVRGQKKTGSPAVSRLVCARIGKEKERRGGGGAGCPIFSQIHDEFVGRLK